MEPIIGQAPNDEDTFLKEKHLESISKQPELMDSIAKQMLTLELAIPGLYVSAIRVSDKLGKINPTCALYLAFASWLLSLVFIIVALVPRAYSVNPDDHTAIRDSFYKTARYKLNWIIASIIAFASGLFFVLKDLIT